MAKRFNPVAFTPGPVTVITTLVYIALLSSLLVVHLIVPQAPSDGSNYGVNLTEAWHDLQRLSNGFHPYNSRQNDEVHGWLLSRIREILESNGVAYSESSDLLSAKPNTRAVVFDDKTSNLTMSTNPFGGPGLTTYFESTNIMVYVRGSNDPEGSFWQRKELKGAGGVLVNAHYDSVPAGYGATDDGVGVISILQLLRHYTVSENQPRKGIVFLLNNGEEDFLNGARAFAMHPLSRFPHIFLNLEGAGAGGRAALFRTTDAEVTRYYHGTESPFGTVILGDAFKLGFVRSQTDYVVFNGNLGMRGLDVAFFEPRARYHTDQDDARHTSLDSIWHMLSAALHSTQRMTSDVEATMTANEGSNGVWFDVLGSSFIVFQLHSLFALSVTLLVVAPIAVAIAAASVSKSGKLYLFSFNESVEHSDSHGKVSLGGLRGFFRFPFIFLAPTAIVIALAFLIVKINPFVTYSSPYAAWSMMLSTWFFFAWFFSRSGDFFRPTALHRTYCWMWMFLLFWVLTVAVTVFEDQINIASGYFIVWYFFVIGIATLISILEQFRLETKRDFASRHYEESLEHERPGTAGTRNTRRRTSTTASSRRSGSASRPVEEDDETEATESTSLLRTPKTPTFANYSSATESERDTESSVEKSHPAVYEYEQGWSGYLPSWLWIVQLLVVAPVTVLLVGQIGLQLVSAAYQTPADGNSPITVYLMIAVFSVLILVPTVPFLHRFTYHVPTFLLFVAIGTLIYNLLAFPFSSNNRLKIYFVQRVDLDTSANEVGLSSIGSPYLDEIVHSLPSTAGQNITKCQSGRADLIEYSWSGLPPRIGYDNWLDFRSTRMNGTNQARFRLKGLNTRGCKLVFNEPIADLNVHGSALDSRFQKMPDEGSKEIRLWTRKWADELVIDASWAVSEGKRDGEEQRDGRVVCLWNDDGHGNIEALEEVRKFAPSWAVAVNLGNGLIEGSKKFSV